MPNSLPLYADKDGIVQVIVNLLSNAIKFTPPKGQILVEAKIFKNGIDAGLLKNKGTFVGISVADTGIGISENQKEKVFEKYETIENKTVQTLHSIGLGLFIARQIVKMHGGKIWVESKVDKGSKFTFIIPQNIKKGLKESEPQVQKSSKKILVMDDESNIRELLSRELNKKGYSVTVAKDGLDGLKKALDYYYDLVITDIRMPGIDGIKCIEVIKRISPNTFFIVITGFSIEEELKEILEKDAYPCIKKPFGLPELLHTVEKRLSVSGNN